MNIILCGLPRSGKTTVGKALATFLEWTFIDTDICIEKAYQASTGEKYSCKEIYALEGESFFRKLEAKQIAALNLVKSNVISLGGGSLCSIINRAKLQSLGSIVYLKVPVDIVWQRLVQTNLPAFLGSHISQDGFERFAKKRIPAYETSANFIVEAAEMSVFEIVQEIVQYWKSI